MRWPRSLSADSQYVSIKYTERLAEAGMLVNNHHHPAVAEVPKDRSMGCQMPGWTAVILDDKQDVEIGPGRMGRLAMRLADSPLAWFNGYALYETYGIARDDYTRQTKFGLSSSLKFDMHVFDRPSALKTGGANSAPQITCAAFAARNPDRQDSRCQYWAISGLNLCARSRESARKSA